MEAGVREQLDLEVPGESLGVWIDPIGSEIVCATLTVHLSLKSEYFFFIFLYCLTKYWQSK